MTISDFLTKERKNIVLDGLFNTQFMRGFLDLPCGMIERGMLGADNDRIKNIDKRTKQNIESDKFFGESPMYIAGTFANILPSLITSGYLVCKYR